MFTDAQRCGSAAALARRASDVGWNRLLGASSVAHEIAINIAFVPVFNKINRENQRVGYQ
ncbi:MAG TPA: hypothetical protein VM240_12435 [Verrucomicrobiae bacterium]|nr:hypothetical protein [Verrucomicrobiae bacterium]